MQILNLIKNYLSIVVFILFSCVINSQDFPPIVKYPPSIYTAGNQNWMISQDDNHFLYFANNDGLLEYNGSNWTLYPSPNETIMRSVKAIDNRIYSGCYMEFGYWKRQKNGLLTYFSLSNKIKTKILDDEQFWNILNHNQWVIFQSLNNIYVYDSSSNKITIIKAKSNIIKAFKVDNCFYYQTVSEGLFEIENGKSKLISNDKSIVNNRIVNIFKSDNKLQIITQNNGFHELINKKLIAQKTEIDPELLANSVYSCIQTSNDEFIIGTISNGTYILSKQKALKFHLTQTKGLSDNTVLSLFEDNDKNIWAGLDNGINCINLESPIKNFFDDSGILGTTYCSIIYKNNLYIGTNQGLFSKPINNAAPFKKVTGTKGQVWSLFEYDGTLFCGHDSGTFIISNENSQNIYSKSGTWTFKTIPGMKDVLLQGNYTGISVLHKTKNGWEYRNKIEGFNYSSRYFEISNTLDFYISHEYKGIFRFKCNAALDKASKLYTYSSPTKGKNACLIKFNHTILYCYKEGIYELNLKTKKFIKNHTISKIFENNEFISGKINIDNNNNLWVFTKNYIHIFSSGKLSETLQKNSIPIPASLTHSMLGFENISQLSDNEYLIGTSDGYFTLNLNKLNFKNYKVSISSLIVNQLNGEKKYVSINQKGIFNHFNNNLTFNFTVPEYTNYINTEYQYLLEGFQNKWSDWHAKPNAIFKNLPPGEYIFKVRAKVGHSSPENIVYYSFIIEKPWYATTFALLCYLLLTGFLIYYIIKKYKDYYKTQNEKLIQENNRLLEINELEQSKKLMMIKNEELARDVDAKNKELAVSSMNLIKKNELLTLIKEDLKKTSEEDNKKLKSVITTINKNINEEDNWNIFREAFDNTDKDFLKKVKVEHPALTPKDLRFCAYLRLNLSSKEIAPLLNISVRSVEIKRYRLRKKMNLNHDQGLVEYILSI